MTIERFGHGGDLVTAQALFAIEEPKWLDFSSNIYPYGPPPRVLEAIKRELEQPGVPVLSRYPDPDARALRQAIACFHQVDANGVVVGNGAAELIDLIVQTLLPSRVGVVQPAFVEYALSAKKRGITVQSVCTRWEEGFLPTESQLETLIREVDLLFVGTPNNPTGHLIPYERLEQMAAWAKQWQTWLVVDEAFLDFVADGEARSALQLVASYPQVLVLRSLTKFFALPGLRLGYVVAAPAVSARVQAMRTPWNVNGLALTAGEVVLHPDVYQAHARKVHRWLYPERTRMVRELGRLPGVAFFPSEANYVLGRIIRGQEQAHQLQHACATQGILIRNCANYPGLGDAYFRIAIKKPEENDRLLAILRSWFG
ncbi:threonine-phosphate decarboxylase CobD [Laceyella putida]|uniref:threonine-phosphate decarboxylase n=1 Tax=Laceyella putida TaxID=110101 RepID=A0ABW2RJW7_9BACL